MATRSAEVKGYVMPDVKARATDLYAHWGMSLSDAINAFLIKSLDVGGLPFDMRLAEKPQYDSSTVIPPDPKFGYSVLPVEMDDEEDDLYDHLIK